MGTKTRYGQAERWKIVAKQHGRTKLSRQPHLRKTTSFQKDLHKQFRYHNDGRPPVTAKDLLRQQRKKQQIHTRSSKKTHTTAISTLSQMPGETTYAPEWHGISPLPHDNSMATSSPLLPNSPRVLLPVLDVSKQKPTRTMTGDLQNLLPSYKWSSNSCWLDTSLEMLWNVVLPDFNDFATCFEQILGTGVEEAALYQLYQLLDRRHTLYRTESPAYSVAILTAQRDQYRRLLADRKHHHIKIIDSVSSMENITV